MQSEEEKMMKKVLIFRTSADGTFKRLYEEVKKNKVSCLIQSSKVERYKESYPDILLIDICQESFYDLPEKVYEQLACEEYDEVYITFSGIVGHNYGNVLEILKKIRYKKAFFYNCNGDKTEICKGNSIKYKLCRWYIKIIQLMYH